MVYDPENPEWTEADFAAGKGPEHLPAELLAAFPNTKRGRGRPMLAPEDRKQQITFRLSPEVLAALRATGDGWRTRVDEILRAALL